MKRRYFGTDGIRGEAGREPLTPEFVLRLGQAAGRYLRQQAERPVVLIGKDTRESGDLLEAALAAGLLSQGVAVEHLGILPTPGVAFLTAELGADASVVISASHNPYQDNGIKFFGPGGTKLSDEAEAAIEELLGADLGTTRIATVRNHQEAERIYMDRLARIGPRLDGLRVAMDTANGATYRVAPRVFQRLGAEVFAVFTTPDGRNINKGCGSTHPETLARIVREGGFDLGVAFDGDGDRVVLIDHEGRVASGDHLLFINAVVREEPLVVGTIMSNLGLERALRERGVAFERTPVGDRYVYEALLRRGDGSEASRAGTSSSSTTCPPATASRPHCSPSPRSRSPGGRSRPGWTRCPCTRRPWSTFPSRTSGASWSTPSFRTGSPARRRCWAAGGSTCAPPAPSRSCASWPRAPRSVRCTKPRPG